MSFFQRNKQNTPKLQTLLPSSLFHPQTQAQLIHWISATFKHGGTVSQGSLTRKRRSEGTDASESAFERWGGDWPSPQQSPTAPSSPPSPSPWKESGGPQPSSWREPTWWPANAQGYLLPLQSVKHGVASGWAAPVVLTLCSKELAVSGDSPSDARDKESYHSLLLSQYCS